MLSRDALLGQGQSWVHALGGSSVKGAYPNETRAKVLAWQQLERRKQGERGLILRDRGVHHPGMLLLRKGPNGAGRDRPPLASVTSSSCLPSPLYSQVVIRRRPLFYAVSLLLPSIFLMVMDIVGFYLPPDCGERVSFKITLLLGYSVFLIIVSDTLPATAIGTPLIGTAGPRPPRGTAHPVPISCRL